ncbi:MAG: hypothetical protein GX231_07160 [Tissierellia bacterium]|jgi:uncharacterized membrane protein YkvI|nr:hypothetical protein [Tissierellia bacterium]
MEGKTSVKNVIKFAGAFVAFMIGSGFATGQEIMQFFTAYGIYSIGGIFISMFLFSYSGAILMRFGYEHKNDTLDAFKYYCGEIFGAFLQWFIPIFLFMVVVVMISGAGATMHQYFGTPQVVGTLIMAALVLVVNLFGLQRIVDIIGLLGPITIAFTIIISIVALAKNPAGLANVAENMAAVGELPKATSSTSTWWLAGILYVAYNVTGSIPFLTEMGKGASTKKEAVLGAIVGGIALMTAGLLLNIALLSYIDKIAILEIPNLYLSDLISPTVSFVFSIILLFEIFSTAAPMLWVTATKFGGEEGTKRNQIAVVVFTILALIGGQLPFGQLVGTVYPYTGYLGIIVLILITIKTIANGRK